MTSQTVALPDPRQALVNRLAGGRRQRVSAPRLGAGILAVVIVASLTVRVCGIVTPGAVDLTHTLEPPSIHHLFGTDDLGRDVFGRTIYAATLDLWLGVSTTVGAMALGLVIGALVGYRGGVLDSCVMRLMDIILAFPFIVFVMAFITIYGPGLTGIYIGFIITGIPVFARLARAAMLGVREQEFILAAETLGFSRGRIIWRHALPHLLSATVVYALANIVLNIIYVAALSYLGLGVQPPTPEWGATIAEGQQYLLTAWWISTLPGLFFVVVCIAIYLAGEGLADPLSRRTLGQ